MRCSLVLLAFMVTTMVAVSYADWPGIPGIIDEITGALLKRKVRFYEEDGGKHRFAEIIYIVHKNKSLEMDDCYLYGNGYILNRILQIIPTGLVTEKVPPSKMSKIINECSTMLYERTEKGLDPHTNKKDISPLAKLRKLFQYAVIFPGTKWCGAGDVADDYDDLGNAKETDMCCRDHDHCDDSIEGFGEKYGVKNKNFYTASHCKCDNQFHECLENATETAAKLTGGLYFNILQTQCFKEDYPIVRCLKTSPLTPIRSPCQEYELDISKPKKWQMFDAKLFPLSNE